MRFPPSFLDEIRARLPVSEVVRRRVPSLKKAGREWKGLSPFTQEKTPSFTVNDQKGFYHCFSTGKHGDQFTFVMETEGLSFPEAVERLAGIAGVPMPVVSPDMERKEARRRTLHDVLELAAKFFEASLQTPLGAAARGYLANRQIHPVTVKEFRIGLAPNSRFALKEYLGKQGVSVQDMIDTGLLISGEDIPLPYDRFRGRLMIPIQDQRGRVVGFGGRSLSDEIKPKYLNSPETTLFQKGSIVFNFHRARQAAHESKFVVAVEGYLDAIAAYQAGIKSVVATLGTAFTENQIDLMWRLAPEPVIAFDGDKAGRAAAERVIERILPVIRTGVSFRFAFLPQGLDPDDLLKKFGVERFMSVLRDAYPLWDMMWEKQLHNSGVVTTPDHKAAFQKGVFDLVALIGDANVRESYKFRARAQLVAFFQSVDWFQSKRNQGRELKFVNRELVTSPDSQQVGTEKILLGTLIHYHDRLLDVYIERLVGTQFSDARVEKFKNELYRIYEQTDELSPLNLYKQIDPNFREVFEDIYGPVAGTPEAVKPQSLYKRFPLLSFDPPLEFVDSCVQLFFQMLEVRSIEQELQQIYTGSKDVISDQILDRTVRLAEHIQLMRAQILMLDHDLADQADAIRGHHEKGRPQFPTRISTAPMVSLPV